MQSDTWIKCTGCCLMLALLFSCVPKKRIVASGGREMKLSRGAKMALMGHVAQQQLHYTTFSGRAKSNLIIHGKQRYDVKANIRIVRDEALWISRSEQHTSELQTLMRNY